MHIYIRTQAFIHTRVHITCTRHKHLFETKGLLLPTKVRSFKALYDSHLDVFLEAYIGEAYDDKAKEELKKVDKQEMVLFALHLTQSATLPGHEDPAEPSFRSGTAGFEVESGHVLEQCLLPR